MKLVQSLVVAALVAVPALSFAQSNDTLTRAQVRAELVQLQQAGYNPASDNAQYPNNIEAAQMRLDARNASSAAAYGGVKTGSASTGSRSPMAQTPSHDVVGLGSIYAHS
jgi:hypothetical protein